MTSTFYMEDAHFSLFYIYTMNCSVLGQVLESHALEKNLKLDVYNTNNDNK